MAKIIKKQPKLIYSRPKSDYVSCTAQQAYEAREIIRKVREELYKEADEEMARGGKGIPLEDRWKEGTPMSDEDFKILLSITEKAA